MEINNKPMTVKSLINEAKRYEKKLKSDNINTVLSGISLKHKIQRKQGQWNNPKKSLMIDSALRSYPTQKIYLIRNKGDNVRYVIEGIQRISTFRDYLDGKFGLSKDLPPVEIDGATHIIAGKKFSDLDEECQSMIENYVIDVCTLEEPTTKDVREIFSRLNNGKPLSNSSLRVIYMSDDILDRLTELTEKPFMKKITSGAQEKSDVNRDWIVQAIMLLETTEDTNLADFRKKTMNDYIKFDINDVEDAVWDSLTNAIDKLWNAYEDIDKLKIPTTSVSVVLYAAAKVVRNKGSFTRFIEILNNFLENYDDNEEYKAYLVSGTSGKESVSARYEYWKGLVKDL